MQMGHSASRWYSFSRRLCISFTFPRCHFHALKIISSGEYSASYPNFLSIFSEEATRRAGAPGRHIYDSYAAGCFFTCFNGFVSETALRPAAGAYAGHRLQISIAFFTSFSCLERIWSIVHSFSSNISFVRSNDTFLFSFS
jgi:hypothetical protein